MYSKLLREIFSTCVYWIREEAFLNYQQAILYNINNRIPAEDIKFNPKEEDYNIYIGKDGSVIIAPVSSEASASEASPATEPAASAEGPQQPNNLDYVMMLNVCGPITRSGGMCTSGSVEHRDMLLSAASDEHCLGACFIVDTPGGSSFSTNDYRQGLDAFKEAGKRSITFVDGQCLSLGMALGCQTDYIVCMNGADEVGCVGAMAAGFIPVHDHVNAAGLRFVHIVASQTPEKNEILRDASEGNYEKLQQSINESAQEFLDLIEEMRPQILPEQRKGKVYRADSVIGTLVDGIGTVDDCINYILTGNLELKVVPSSAASASAAAPEASASGASSATSAVDGSAVGTQPGEAAAASAAAPEASASEASPATVPAASAEGPQQPNNPNKENNMIKMTHILAALNLEELPVKDGGIFLNEELVNQLDDALTAQEQAASPEAPAAAPATEQPGEASAASPEAPAGSAEGGSPAAEAPEAPSNEEPAAAAPAAASPEGSAEGGSPATEEPETPSNEEPAAAAPAAASPEGSAEGGSSAAPTSEQPEAAAGTQQPAASAEGSHNEIVEQYEARIRNMQEQHNREMQDLRDQLAELANSTTPAPAPKNKGVAAGSVAEPPKDYRKMTIAEKKAVWDNIGKK